MQYTLTLGPESTITVTNVPSTVICTVLSSMLPPIANKYSSSEPVLSSTVTYRSPFAFRWYAMLGESVTRFGAVLQIAAKCPCSYFKFFRLLDKKNLSHNDLNVHNKNRQLASCHGSVLVDSSHSLVDTTVNFPCFSHLIFETHYKSC